MFESVKGFSAVAVSPNLIRVNWDSIDQPSSKGVKIVWWCIGDPGVETLWAARGCSQHSIEVESGKTYVIAARAYYPFSYLGSWVYAVVEVSQIKEPRHSNLGQATVIDTPRGPAILLDELREACG